MFSFLSFTHTTAAVALCMCFCTRRFGTCSSFARALAQFFLLFTCACTIFEYFSSNGLHCFVFHLVVFTIVSIRFHPSLCLSSTQCVSVMRLYVCVHTYKGEGER